MSRNKRGSLADGYYEQHLNGVFNRNPAVTRESIIERMYLRILTELATNRFKWSGLPDSVDERFLEMTLFRHALSVFYFDNRFDQFLSLKGTPQNWLNMMDNPTGFLITGNNFQSITVGAKDAVPIWANYVRVPDWDIVMIYANKLANIDRSIEINAQNARQNKMVLSSENQRLSVVNINRQIDEGQNGIQVNGAVQDLEFIKVVDLGVDPDHIEKLHIVRTRLWNECMGLLGIENANQDKKERLVAAEVNANDDQTSMMRYVNLNARLQACDDINKRFKLNVSVEYHTDEEKMLLAGSEVERENDLETAD